MPEPTLIRLNIDIHVFFRIQMQLQIVIEMTKGMYKHIYL